MLANAAQDAPNHAAPEAAHAGAEITPLDPLTCPYCASGTINPDPWPSLSQAIEVEI